MTIFQGGGLYDKQGQLIIATKTDDGRIAFMDSSRCIDGFVEHDETSFDGIDRQVNKAYIHNQYTTPSTREEYDIIRELRRVVGDVRRLLAMGNVEQCEGGCEHCDPEKADIMAEVRGY